MRANKVLRRMYESKKEEVIMIFRINTLHQIVTCHHGMAYPHVTCEGDGHQM
jgi:hypothetical protein